MPKAYPPFGTHLESPESFGDSNTIDVQVWRWDGNSGSVLVSSGLILKPGLVSTTNLDQVRVYVEGAEQAVALHPVDGLFPDGTYRSVGVQFQYNLTNNVPVFGQVKINQGLRGTTDIAWVKPTKTGVINKRAVIVPSDPVYLCDTFVTLMPLIPAANDTAVGTAWSNYANTTWDEASGDTRTGNRPGTAMYQHAMGKMAQYCRTGVRSHYQWAYDWCVEMMDSTIIDAGPGGAGSLLVLPQVLPGIDVGPPEVDRRDTCLNSNEIYNPERLLGINPCGYTISNEAYSMRAPSLAMAYWMTAWPQFKRNLDSLVQWGMRLCPSSYANARDTWLSVNYGVRHNLGVQGMYHLIPAYLTGCTTSFAQSGLQALSSFNYETFLPYLLQALEDHIWNLPSDYRNGLVGQRHGTISTPLSGGDERWGVLLFQLALIAEELILYNDLVKPDARIHTWMKTIADYVISQTRAAISTADPHYSESQGAVRWVSSYDNLPPSVIQNSTFQASTIAGNPEMTYLSGPFPLDLRLIGVQFSGPGITVASGTHPLSINVATSKITMNHAPTVTGTGTYTTGWTAWYITMLALTMAWVWASTGDITYKTWAERFAFSGNILSLGPNMETKTWGEAWGGTRMSVLYYLAGGQIRGTPGVHPTDIVNPPAQSSLE